MSRIETDVLLVGSGLGAAATARGLVDAGYDVVLVPGAGRTRSAHIDGGLVDDARVASVFGEGAPLGEPVDRLSTLRLESRTRFMSEAPVPIQPRRRYRRQDLEEWAMARVTGAGALLLEDFVEGKAIPGAGESIVLTSERDDREIHARVMALCEGCDPRIPLRVHLRPDYGPEDQLHFARTIFHGFPSTAMHHGAWRTSWGMPVELTLTPQHDGTLLSVTARIENVMRASRSSKDAMEDLIASPAFDSLGIGGDRRGTGMELVALRARRQGMRFVHDRMAMGIDACGVIDPRRPDRADLTILSGRHLGAYLAERDLVLDGWQERALELVADAVGQAGAYHDDRDTGFLEEGPAHLAGMLANKISGLMRRRGSASFGTG